MVRPLEFGFHNQVSFKKFRQFLFDTLGVKLWNFLSPILPQSDNIYLLFYHFYLLEFPNKHQAYYIDKLQMMYKKNFNLKEIISLVPFRIEENWTERVKLNLKKLTILIFYWHHFCSITRIATITAVKSWSSYIATIMTVKRWPCRSFEKVKPW